MDREAREYWRGQRRQMLLRDRRTRGGYSRDMWVTKVLIGLVVLAYLVEAFVPRVVLVVTHGPGGVVGSLILAALSPGGLLGLVFTVVSLWIIGMQLEALTPWWQYVILFFASGIIGGLASRVLGAGLVGGTFASFGLAGAYVMAMASRRVGGAAQWAIVLLAIDVVLSGFNPGVLAGMLAAFFTGLVIARIVRI